MDEERAESGRVAPDDGEGDGTVVVVHHDWESDEGIAVAVARGVAEAWTGDRRDVTSLPPVGSAVDVDALERLFVSSPGESVDRTAADAEPTMVRFGYAGYDVTVRQDGLVTVEEPPY